MSSASRRMHHWNLYFADSKSMFAGKSALIIGATGQVGRNLLQELLRDSSYTRVGEYGRRITPTQSIRTGGEKLEQKTINFDKIDEVGLKDGKWDVVFIT